MNSIVPAPRRAKRDWPSIRLAYLNGEGSLKTLSERFGVPMRTMERRCSNEQWRSHAAKVGGKTAAVAVALAVQRGQAMAEKLNMPERSAKLREQVVTELEKDADLVAKTPPHSLADSQARQNVLGGIVRNAETALDWNNKQPAPCIRIGLMMQSYVREPDAPEIGGTANENGGDGGIDINSTNETNERDTP